MDLGYQRGRAVLEYLVNDQAIEAARFRVVSAGASEPMHAGNDPAGMRSNARVEVFLLDETVNDLRGTPDERADETLNDRQNKEPDGG
jgi:chemotaxis protein MotB